MTRITVRISVDHGTTGANFTETCKVAEGESARKVLHKLLSAGQRQAEDTLPPEQSTTTDSGEIAEWFNGEDGGDSRDPFMVELLAYLRDRDELTAEDSADESLPDLLERIQRILPNLEALVAKLEAPRPKAEDGRRSKASHNVGTAHVEIRPNLSGFTEELARSIEETAREIRAAL